MARPSFSWIVIIAGERWPTVAFGSTAYMLDVYIKPPFRVCYPYVTVRGRHDTSE